MAFSRAAFLTRAADAFSSFAVTVALAVLTILALAIGSMRDGRAEPNAGLMLQQSKVEEPKGEWHGTADVAGRSLPERPWNDAQPVMMSRRPLRSTRSFGSVQTVEMSPTQQWMGVSKLAFPLLVGDLSASRSPGSLDVMRGQPVGTR